MRDLFVIEKVSQTNKYVEQMNMFDMNNVELADASFAGWTNIKPATSATGHSYINYNLHLITKIYHMIYRFSFPTLYIYNLHLSIYISIRALSQYYVFEVRLHFFFKPVICAISPKPGRPPNHMNIGRFKFNLKWHIWP